MVRGDSSWLRGASPQVGAYIADLHDAGVFWEVSGVPAGWLEAEKPMAVAKAVDLESPKIERDMPAVAKVLEAQVAVKAAVWREGSAEGVVVVVRGRAAPQGEEAALLGNMLKAVGLHELPLGFVGADLAEDLWQAGLEREIGEQVCAMAPQQVLVLGSSVLGSWLGKNRGVEGWVTEGHGLPGVPEGVRVGVTYALPMLRAKPLFKRLAWKHLVMWKGVGA